MQSNFKQSNQTLLDSIEAQNVVHPNLFSKAVGLRSKQPTKVPQMETISRHVAQNKQNLSNYGFSNLRKRRFWQTVEKHPRQPGPLTIGPERVKRSSQLAVHVEVVPHRLYHHVSTVRRAPRLGRLQHNTDFENTGPHFGRFRDALRWVDTELCSVLTGWSLLVKLAVSTKPGRCETTSRRRKYHTRFQ